MGLMWSVLIVLGIGAFIRAHYTVRLKVYDQDLFQHVSCYINDYIHLHSPKWFRPSFQVNRANVKLGYAFFLYMVSFCFVKYDGKWFFVRIRFDENRKTLNSYVMYYDILTLGRERSVIESWLKKCEDLYEDKSEKKIKIYTYADQDWNKVANRPKRSLESVHLEEDSKQMLVDDLGQFYSSYDWYRDMGVPYHRMFLLYGVPGCGKTSFIHAIASHFDKNLYVLNIGNVKSDADLMAAFNYMLLYDSNCILVIEDIDVAQKNRKVQSESVESDHSPISMSGLLNALDGLATGDGLVCFMTTNCYEDLDNSITRDGRCDREVEFMPLRTDMIQSMFNRFFPESECRITVDWITPATIQGCCMRNREDDEAAAREINNLKTDYKPMKKVGF